MKGSNVDGRILSHQEGDNPWQDPVHAAELSWDIGHVDFSVNGHMTQLNPSRYPGWIAGSADLVYFLGPPRGKAQPGLTRQ